MDEDKEERDIEDLKSTMKLSYEVDPIGILATKINSVNIINYDQFVCSTQFDIKEPETYARAIKGPLASQ